VPYLNAVFIQHGGTPCLEYPFCPFLEETVCPSLYRISLAQKFMILGLMALGHAGYSDRVFFSTSAEALVVVNREETPACMRSPP
jgi:hypothetical protein